MLVPAAADASPPSPRRISWAACGPRLECATVPVPLDWRHPRGPSIDLAAIRHLASRGESLDAMTGGRFDIVGWDPRGSGGGAPVSCFADPSERASFWDGLPVPTTRAEERRYLARTIALAQRCGARNGDRRHSFLGESTGTLIGQSYANLSPRRVRAMVLDGVEDPVRFTAGTAAALAQSFTDIDRTFERLGNVVLLTHDGYGHLSSADPSTCVVRATGRHLVDLATPARGTVRPSDRLPFDPDFDARRSP